MINNWATSYPLQPEIWNAICPYHCCYVHIYCICWPSPSNWIPSGRYQSGMGNHMVGQWWQRVDALIITRQLIGVHSTITPNKVLQLECTRMYAQEWPEGGGRARLNLGDIITGGSRSNKQSVRAWCVYSASEHNVLFILLQWKWVPLVLFVCQINIDVSCIACSAHVKLHFEGVRFMKCVEAFSSGLCSIHCYCRQARCVCVGTYTCACICVCVQRFLSLLS